jgi:hypothetical protein
VLVVATKANTTNQTMMFLNELQCADPLRLIILSVLLPQAARSCSLCPPAVPLLLPLLLVVLLLAALPLLLRQRRRSHQRRTRWVRGIDIFFTWVNK